MWQKRYGRELRSEYLPGTGWHEMTRQFWLWAKYYKGYKVPAFQDVIKDPYPNYNNPNV